MNKHLALLAILGSFALLAGAFAFQYLGGLPPCKLCLYQRWPHAIAIVLGATIITFGAYRFALLPALATLATAGVGIYHVGVEKTWWEGPNTCSSGSIEGLNPEELLNQILNAPTVRCDEVLWEFMGLSMAGWNALIALGLTLIWLWVWKKA